VLLLDEPLGALDKKLREETQFELMDLQQELGLTFMIVTHDQEEAMTMSDRIAVMDHGRILQIGTPAEVYEAPVSRYVADFVGNVNLFEGTVDTCSGGQVELAGKDGFPLRANCNAEIDKGATAWFAIRPEKLKVSKKKPDGVNAVEGEVWDIGYLGDMTIFNVRLASGAVIKASVLNARREVEDPIGYDERIWVSFAPEAGILLTQ
jgi:putrescine transport system ATP-binding protein